MPVQSGSHHSDPAEPSKPGRCDRAAVTEYHRLGGFKNRTYCLTVLRPQSDVKRLAGLVLLSVGAGGREGEVGGKDLF